MSSHSTPIDASIAADSASKAATPMASSGARSKPNVVTYTSEVEVIEIPILDVSHLVTEDDAPVDNLIQEKLQRLLVESLYSSLKRQRPFLAAANLGVFYGLKQQQSVAPDVLLSLNVAVPEDWSEKRKRSYFVWEFGKPPEVVIEIVSNPKVGELDEKLEKYTRVGAAYYVVFDPLEQLSSEILQVYGLHEGAYQPLPDAWLEAVGLGLTVWEGEFETKFYHRWLRWCDREGNLLLTGDERAQQAEQQTIQTRQQAQQERQRAEQAEQQAQQERQRAEQAEQEAQQERERAERLAALLRSQGMNPDELP